MDAGQLFVPNMISTWTLSGYRWRAWYMIWESYCSSLAQKVNGMLLV